VYCIIVYFVRGDLDFALANNISQDFYDSEPPSALETVVPQRLSLFGVCVYV